jgi:hypothetical protein
VRLTATQRIALRGLFDKGGVTTRSGEEELRAPAFFDALNTLMERAGGEAPLPQTPKMPEFEELKRLSGTEQLGALYERRDVIEEQITAWNKLAKRAEVMQPAWKLATALRRHATGLPVTGDVGPQLDAIVSRRALLEPTDEVRPVVSKLGAALRSELTNRHAALAQAVLDARNALSGDVTWSRLDKALQTTVFEDTGLEDPSLLKIATDEALLLTLDSRPLSAWQDNIDAIPQRVARALEEAVKRLAKDSSEKPATTVTIRRGTLVDEPAVLAWLAEQERKLVEAVRNGPVIIR